MKKKVRFIINPISGIGRQKTVERLIPEVLNSDLYIHEICYTTGRGDAHRLSAEAVEKNIDIVVAVGGDGTVGEIASALVNSEVEFGIIPAGSGNGLARGLQIPIMTRKALKTLNKYNIVQIDTGRINGKYFANMAGVGFDAHIAKHFYKLKNRGILNYLRLCTREFFRYKSRNYTFEYEGKTFSRLAWVVGFANSRQYGNNALVAPQAVPNDKLLDAVIVRPFPLIALPFMIYRLFKGTLDDSRYVETFRFSKMKCHLEQYGTIHLDGDPHKLGKVLDIEIVPQSVKVIVPVKQLT